MLTIHETIKDEIAEKAVDMAAPGYSQDAQGTWYVVDGNRVLHAERMRPWNPWPDDAEVIAVDDLLWLHGGGQEDNASFDPTPEGDVSEDDAYDEAVAFARTYVPDAYVPSARDD